MRNPFLAAAVLATLGAASASAQTTYSGMADTNLQKACLTAAAAHFGTTSVGIASGSAIPGGMAYEMSAAGSDRTWTCQAIRGSAYAANSSQGR